MNKSGSGWIVSGGSLGPQKEPVPMPMPEPVMAPMPESISKPTPAFEPMPMPAPPVIEQGDYLEEIPLIMSFVRMQKWDQTYEAETGMERGTIFPELDLPFVGEGACLHDE